MWNMGILGKHRPLLANLEIYNSFSSHHEWETSFRLFSILLNQMSCNFAVVVSNDLCFQIFKQSWKQSKWCTLDTFLTPRKTGEKTEKCNEKCIFSWLHPELYRRKVAPAFSSTLHASSSADIPWPTNWPWKIQGLGMGWPERPWVGLADKKKWTTETRS